MISGGKKNRKGLDLFKNILPKIFAVFVLAVMGFFIVSNFKLFKERSQLSSKIASLQKEAKRLEENNKELEFQISQGTDENFIEKQARERLNLKKSGENVVVVLPPKDNIGQIERKNSLWNRILEMFKF